MAQRPTNDFDIDPNITSGTDLANILNRFQDAMDSGNSGASRPAYLAAGGMWVKEGDPMRLYLYDGTKDIELYNTTDGIVGAIEDGTVDGQITTWNAASGEWTPEGGVVVNANGNVGIGPAGSSNGIRLHLSDSAPAQRFSATSNASAGSPIGVVQFSQDAGSNPGVSSMIRGIDENGDNAGALTFYTGQTPPSMKERVRIDASGNVGIGHSNPTSKLVVSNGGYEGFEIDPVGVNGYIRLFSYDRNNGGEGTYIPNIWYGTAWDFYDGNAATYRMRIDASGRVGIGGEPGTRTAGEYLEQAKERIASWKAEVKKRTAEQPEASTQEITLEVTDGDFGVFPTAEVLAEKLAERAIGGGSAKLQVSGDGYFSGNAVVQGGVLLSPGKSGISFQGDAIQPINKVNGASDAQVDLGLSGVRFKDAHFSGTVYANGSPLTRATDLIETLSTLREATRDETTLEGLRDALSDAIGGLIQKFEAQVSTTDS